MDIIFGTTEGPLYAEFFHVIRYAWVYAQTVKFRYRIPRMYCEMLVNVHAAVPVSQLFLLLRNEQHQCRLSSVSIHNFQSCEDHLHPGDMPDRFSCIHQKHGLPCPTTVSAIEIQGCCDRKFLHFLCNLPDKKLFHQAQDDKMYKQAVKEQCHILCQVFFD